MALVIFDLDDTLIDGDSASLWLRFLVREGLADASMIPCEEEMMHAYRQGRLQMSDYMYFTLQPLQRRSRTEVAQWAARFIEQDIAPIVYPQARAALEAYQQEGRRVVVVSATGEHLVAPIARSLGVGDVLAISLEVKDDHYTGATTGVLTYQQGKVTRLHQWLEQTGENLAGSHGYSDSVNDIPLLQAVDTAFVVNPDDRLAAQAQTAQWQRLDWTR